MNIPIPKKMMNKLFYVLKQNFFQKNILIKATAIKQELGHFSALICFMTYFLNRSYLENHLGF